MTWIWSQNHSDDKHFLSYKLKTGAIVYSLPRVHNNNRESVCPTLNIAPTNKLNKV